jgi:imidazolonepropionase
VTTTLLTGIGELVTNDPSHGDGTALGLVRDAALVIDDDGRIAWLGAASSAPAADDRIDVAGATVLPGFVDSHTHLVFGGDRADEFVARMAGGRYEAGGIASTVAATRATSTATLQERTARLVREAQRQGTTTLEVKSGYGLATEEEARLLTVAAHVTTETTFLGAHAVPPEYTDRRDDYVALVMGEMLQTCAPLARWIDVFCDVGAFDEDQTRAVLAAGSRAGLRPRLHGNQLAHGPGVSIAVETGCASVDHCTHLNDDDIEALASSQTVATLLPAAEFSSRSNYPAARSLIDAGATVALATDCNPGSSFTTSMPFCIALAVREMGMTPAEAVWSATAGGAAALQRHDVGAVTIGARADLVVLDAPTYGYLAYRPGVPLVTQTWIGGAPINR